MAKPFDVTYVTPSCTFCEKPAVFYEPVEKCYFCKNHFIDSIENKVYTTITESKQIRSGDHVAVALSGGKDSTALLIILSRLLPKLSGSHLTAITIDEGIAGYRTETMQAAERLTKQLGVKHHIVTFRSIVGRDLDELLRGREKQACTICGILRKKAIADAAKTVDASVIATGHNLDDEAQSVLMNALRGDLPRLIRNTGTSQSSLFLPRVKPLSALTEKEIAVYLFVQGIFSPLPECPYAEYALRAEVRTMLAKLEAQHPGTMRHLIECKKKIERYCSRAKVMESLQYCRECGDPCSGNICQVCRIKQYLGI